MKRILATAVAAVTGLAVLAPAAPALAAASITSVALSTTTTVINGDSGCGDRIKATITVADPANETDGNSADIESFAPNGDSVDFAFPLARTHSGTTTTYTGWINICGFHPPGRYRAHAEVFWFNDADSGASFADRTFYVKRPTSLTYNAAPEPARRGSLLTHSGRLMFDPFAPGGFYGPSGQVLQLAFKAAGTASYVSKGTVTTGAGGYYSRRVATTGDGIWRLTFPTNTWRQTQVKYDFVDTV